MQYLVQYATHPDVGSRLESVSEFIKRLDDLEDEVSQPNTLRTNPTEARKGDLLPGGFGLFSRLAKVRAQSGIPGRLPGAVSRSEDRFDT
ncbi:hypothetical protein P4118_29425 [Pseudomonas aeruginosa]|nr:hypothetical protein [Pseudomonas aeruginosa]